MSTASPTFWCGENVGCGTTTDESDEDSASKETQIPVAKKVKVDVACKRRSKRLENMQKRVKDSGSGIGSHSSQQIIQTKQSGSQTKRSGSGKRGGRQQGKTDQGNPSGTKGKKQKDSETGY